MPRIHNTVAMDDEYLEEEMMDDYFLGTPEEYVDPQAGWTRQEAYLAYREACDIYEANWVGTPWYERTEDPPRWEDFWQD